MSEEELAEIVWNRLSDAVAERLGDMDSSDPENLKVVIVALLSMAARSAVVSGRDAEWFMRMARAAFEGNRDILLLEGPPTAAAIYRRAGWQSCFRGS